MREPTQPYRPSYPSRFNRHNDKKCYVCGKKGCWSIRHPREERAESHQRFKTYVQSHTHVDDNYDAFLAEFEGIDINDEGKKDDDEELDAFFNNEQAMYQFNTSGCGAVDEQALTIDLKNAAATHATTKDDP